MYYSVTALPNEIVSEILHNARRPILPAHHPWDDPSTRRNFKL
jgi:hypothetical protein